MSDKSKPRHPSQLTLLGLITLQAAAFTALGAGIWYLSDRPLRAFVEFDVSQAWSGLLLGLFLIVIAAGVFFGFPRLSEKLVRLQSDTYSFLQKPFSLPAIVWISICAGVWEEAFFRGGVQTFLTDLIGDHLAIFLTSAVFAAMHMAKPVISAILLAMGLLFGYVYWASGSLLLVMIGHAVYDVFAIAYLQREMHRLQVFGSNDTPDQDADATQEIENAAD